MLGSLVEQAEAISLSSRNMARPCTHRRRGPPKYRSIQVWDLPSRALSLTRASAAPPPAYPYLTRDPRPTCPAAANDTRYVGTNVPLFVDCDEEGNACPSLAQGVRDADPTPHFERHMADVLGYRRDIQ